MLKKQWTDCFVSGGDLKTRPEQRCISNTSGLTDALLAGVGQVVVARHVVPVAAVVPHHHCTVLAGQEVAVRLASVPVLIELTEKQEGATLSAGL